MKQLVVVDCEVYPNYFLAAFKNIRNNKIVTIEAKGKDNSLDDVSCRKLKSTMFKYKTFGFNSRNYDLPVMLYAIKNKTCSQIHELSDYIINEKSQGWQTMRKYSLSKSEHIDHFDIQEPAPGVRVSLKLYGGRMHSKRLQDLPIEPGTMLSNDEMETTRLYCINDLNTTIDLYNQIEDRLHLRAEMGQQYNKDLMSKSDAQIAEIIIKSELHKRKPFKKLYAPKIPEGKTFRYEIPDFISFKSEKLQGLVDILQNHDFELDEKGYVIPPDEFKKMKINIGYSNYKFGIGGLHSKEKKQSIIPTKHQLLIDRDISACYPNVILNMRLYPQHIGSDFLDIYQNIVTTRLKAKKSGNKIVNESLKIVINGSYGKLGSKWSILYSPDLMVTVTLTGQLSVLMLIEKLEDAGISVISANTDGFVSLMTKDKYELYDNICFDWELTTGCNLEETGYKALYSRDVNNYLAITNYGSKGVGIFKDSGLTKSPQAYVCAIAVKNLLVKGIPIKKTIIECKDITKFLTIRTVKGGAVWKDKYLGKVVRWIYSTEGEAIVYKKNGNKVAKSDGARPVMELGKFPEDLDYDRYIEESKKILDSLGLDRDQ